MRTHQTPAAIAPFASPDVSAAFATATVSLATAIPATISAVGTVSPTPRPPPPSPSPSPSPRPTPPPPLAPRRLLHAFNEFCESYNLDPRDAHPRFLAWFVTMADQLMDAKEGNNVFAKKNTGTVACEGAHRCPPPPSRLHLSPTHPSPSSHPLTSLAPVRGIPLSAAPEPRRRPDRRTPPRGACRPTPRRSTAR